MFYLANEWSPFRGHIGEKIKKKKKGQSWCGILPHRNVLVFLYEVYMYMIFDKYDRQYVYILPAAPGN